MTRSSGEQPTRRLTVAELLAQHGKDAGGGSGRRHRRRAPEDEGETELNTTAPQEIIDRIHAEQPQVDWESHRSNGHSVDALDTETQATRATRPATPEPARPEPKPGRHESRREPEPPPPRASRTGTSFSPPIPPPPGRQPRRWQPAESLPESLREMPRREPTVTSPPVAKPPVAKPLPSPPASKAPVSAKPPVAKPLTPAPPSKPPVSAKPDGVADRLNGSRQSMAPAPPPPRRPMSRPAEGVTDEFDVVDDDFDFDPRRPLARGGSTGYGYLDEDVDELDYADDELAEDEPELLAGRDPAVLADEEPLEDEVDELSPGKQWLAVGAQLALGVVGGAAVWLLFNWLWNSMPAVALAAALIVTAGLVWIVRNIRKAEDMQSTVLAVLVGLVVTVSPAALLLLSR
jgi:hypothetical protein